MPITRAVCLCSKLYCVICEQKTESKYTREEIKQNVSKNWTIDDHNDVRIFRNIK